MVPAALSPGFQLAARIGGCLSLGTPAKPHGGASSRARHPFGYSYYLFYLDVNLDFKLN